MDEGKLWSKPQLVILARGRPEESVLATCKKDSTSSGPSNKKSSCNTSTILFGGHCTGDCSSITGHS